MTLMSDTSTANEPGFEGHEMPEKYDPKTFELHKGDCLEIMPKLPEHSVDLVLCDLPFGITRNKWDVPLPLDKLWDEYHRIAKPNTAFVLHCQQPFTSQLIMSNLKEFKYAWVWYKHYARGFLNAKRQPMRNTEDIAVFYKRRCTYNPQMVKGKYRAKGNSSNQRGCYDNYTPVKTVNDVYYPTTIIDFAGVPVPELMHPTQKPVDLLAYLIRTYTNDGDTILDNCMGVGSTGAAVLEVGGGRRFIGIEKNEEYFQVAKERLEKLTKESAI